MGLARSTCYDQPARVVDDTALVDAMCAIGDEFEAYGYRRMGAALRQQGLVVNHKKLRRLMRDHDLQPKPRRRYVATTDSTHDGPIFPNRVKDLARAAPTSNGSETSPTSRCPGASSTSPSFSMPGHGWSSATASAGRSIDARLTLAALHAAVQRRTPPPGCIHHSDRGAQYAAVPYRELLAAHGLIGSMGRRGNPYDNATAESFMKTLNVEAIYPMAFDAVQDVVDHLPHFIEETYNRRRLHSALGYLSPQQYEDQHLRQTGN
jgi:putative transposase